MASAAISGFGTGRSSTHRRIPRSVPTGRLTPSGLVVMPGGVDMHCHIAGPKVNAARKMRPEQKRKAEKVVRTREHAQRHDGQRPEHLRHRLQVRRAGLHHRVRRRDSAARRAPRPRRVRRHALHRQGILRPHGQQPLRHGVDPAQGAGAAAIVRRLAVGSRQGLTRRRSSTPAASRSGSSCRAATSTASTRTSRTSMSRRGRSSNEVARAVDALRLPHSVHLHCNNLGMPGNWRTTLETMKTLGDSRGHLAHIQFHSYGGGEGDENTFNSKVAELVEYVNTHPNLTVDVGQVLFGETTTMTARRTARLLPEQRVQEQMVLVRHRDGSRAAASRRSSTRTRAWCIPCSGRSGWSGICWSKDPWRVVMSTDHPNGGSFLAYPQIIQLLMDRTYRQDMLKLVHPAVLERSTLADLTREYSLLRDLHHHAERPGEDPGSRRTRAISARRRCRHHHLHAERRQDEDVRAAAHGHQERRRHRRAGRDSRTDHREAVVRGA